MSPFCKVCGTLLKLIGEVWNCPKGHDKSLVDRVVQSEEGTRVLIPIASTKEDSFWKDFWKYICKHGAVVYALKIENRKPKYNLHIIGDNPCEKCLCMQRPEGYQLKTPMPKEFESDYYGP